MYLEQNIKGICQKYGLDFQEFLNDFQAEHVMDFSLFDLESIAEEYQLDLQSLLFQPLYNSNIYANQLAKIKLLILDIDGVMTDGGMYMMMNGDQMKKFNTKDGLGIIRLIRSGMEVAIISSGMYDVAVTKRAEMLGIQHCFVGRKPKLETLDELKNKLHINYDEIAMIGDDINDLEVMQKIGFSACPKDAVVTIKNQVNIILQTKGGEGCVREFIDGYLNAARE